MKCISEKKLMILQNILIKVNYNKKFIYKCVKTMLLKFWINVKKLMFAEKVLKKLIKKKYNFDKYEQNVAKQL